MDVTRRELMAAVAAAAAARTARVSPEPAEATGATTAEHRGWSNEHIAMVLYPGFTALDFVGPYHFLGGTGARIHLVTNQPNLRPVQSDLGLAIQPTAMLHQCPENLTLLFVPGGTSGTIAAARDPKTIEFIRLRAASARYVTSVCTGSLVLGAAGLLRGKRATSH